MKATHNAPRELTVNTKDMPTKVTLDEWGEDDYYANLFGDKDYYLLKLTKVEIELLMLGLIAASEKYGDEKAYGHTGGNFYYLANAIFEEVVNKYKDDFADGNPTLQMERIKGLLDRMKETEPLIALDKRSKIGFLENYEKALKK